MFNKPLKVQVEANNFAVNHNVSIDSYDTDQILKQFVKSTMIVVVGTTVVRTTASIALHIVKTKIQ